MRIGIDVRCLAEGRKTGVEEYTVNLLKNLFKIDQKNKYVLFLNSFKALEGNLDWIGEYPNVSVKRFSFPNKLINFLFWYLNWPKIDRLLGGVDVFFSPNIIFNSVSKKVRHVMTFHDLSFERYPRSFSLKRRLWHSFINPKKMAQKADDIISVSDSTKEDLISLYGVEPKKIKSISSGIENKFAIINRNDKKLVDVKEKYQLPFKFILYLGTIEPRKNIISIIKAFNCLQKFAEQENIAELLKFKLAIAGSPGWLNQGIYKEIEKSKYHEKIVILNFIEDKDKEYILNLASLFVYPSAFEGFGFPPLEAMKCGVPTIVSNNSSLPEVAGGGAIMINPEKPDELFEAIKHILMTRELKEKMQAAALKKSADFNWEKTAKEVLNVFSKIHKF